MRLGATSTESSYSAPKRLAAPVSTSVKKPNLLAQAYNALLNIPGPQISSPVNTGRGVSIGGQQGAMQLTVEPLRQAGRRAVGDLMAIPGIGRPSPSPTAADVRRGNYVGPVADYVNLALTVAPAVKAIRKPRVLFGKQIPNDTVTPKVGPTIQERVPTNRLTRSDDIKMVNFGNEIDEPIGSIDIRSYNPTTNEINGVVGLHFVKGQPGLLSSMYAKSPSATTQLISAAQRIAKELLPNMEYPLSPSSSLSPHSYVFVKRLMDAGLIDPNYSLPEPQFLNSMTLRDIDEYLNGWKAVGNTETVINPLYYQQDYKQLRAALANAQRNRTQRSLSAREVEQLANEKRGFPQLYEAIIDGLVQTQQIPF